MLVVMDAVKCMSEEKGRTYKEKFRATCLLANCTVVVH